MISVLVIEDVPGLKEFAAGLSGDNEFFIVSCSGLPEALEKARSQRFDVVASGPSGLELAKKMKLEGKKIPLVLFSGESNEILTVEAVSSGMDLILIPHGDLALETENIRNMLRKAAIRKRYCDDMEKKEAKYLSVIESMDDSIYMVDRDCRYLFMNQKHLSRLGRSSGLYKGKTYRDFHSEEETLRFEAQVRQVFSTGARVDEERDAEDGTKFLRSFEPVRNIDDDTIVAVNVISRKVPLSVEFAFPYRKSENLPGKGENSVYMVDRDCRYLSINPRHLERLGITAEETYLGKTYEDLHMRGKTEAFSRIVGRVFETGEVAWDEYQAGNHHFSRRFCPVRDRKSGEVIAVTVVSSNITDLKMTEKSLIEANRKLNLLSSLTRHDIINNLTALRGYVELSMMDDPGQDQLRYLEKMLIIADSITHQISFTSDYQDIGVKSPQWQDVREIIENAAQLIDMQCITLEIGFRDLKVFADPMLEKVFYNLIQNAVAHGGKITKITFSAHRHTEGVTVVCEDDGIGIPDAEKELIFIRGFGKNTGLGLFLIREILSITGMSIKERGTYGKGARFEIMIPNAIYSCE
ncbi:PAS domain S-box-containing protein [Methanolinea mesophila]|uniref:hybrid sensor histidine kinase/response regulator n=1 Tax=Methanolinea mesophila TaxID=547055 RepID=UPI001AE6B46F|nr:PAS domain-containing protein [Methanolinea mesophila]MBP1928126.1 PAS domain S-box-containing protein [Methanolinea mesophila]